MAQAAAIAPQQAAQAQRQQQQQIERSRVHATDLDFLFVLVLAVFFDALDIFLELGAVLIIPKLLGMFLDGLTFIVIGVWIYKKTKNLDRAKRQHAGTSGRRTRVFLTFLRRVGLTFIAELIVFVGLLPLWTIAVILTLRQR